MGTLQLPKFYSACGHSGFCLHFNHALLCLICGGSTFTPLSTFSGQIPTLGLIPSDSAGSWATPAAEPDFLLVELPLQHSLLHFE